MDPRDIAKGLTGWQPIETAPRGEVIVGLRVGAGDDAGFLPAFVGELYDMRPNALIDRWRGKWVVCSHWTPLPAPPAILQENHDA